MKKKLNVENLDCANCAAKLEKGIAGLEGVEKVTVSFMAQRILLEVQEDKYPEILTQMKKLARKIEPDCEIYE